MLQYNIEHTGTLKQIQTFWFSCVIIDIDALRNFYYVFTGLGNFCLNFHTQIQMFTLHTYKGGNKKTMVSL